jgi:hypothetical protein
LLGPGSATTTCSQSSPIRRKAMSLASCARSSRKQHPRPRPDARYDRGWPGRRAVSIRPSSGRPTSRWSSSSWASGFGVRAARPASCPPAPQGPRLGTARLPSRCASPTRCRMSGRTAAIRRRGTSVASYSRATTKPADAVRQASDADACCFQHGFPVAGQGHTRCAQRALLAERPRSTPSPRKEQSLTGTGATAGMPME